jgi:hypothetical protein
MTTLSAVEIKAFAPANDFELSEQLQNFYLLLCLSIVLDRSGVIILRSGASIRIQSFRLVLGASCCYLRQSFDAVQTISSLVNPIDLPASPSDSLPD